MNDRRVTSGIIFVIENCLRWHDAPTDNGSHKMITHRLFAGSAYSTTYS